MKRIISWNKPTFYGKEKNYLVDALNSTWISGGYYVDKFEKEFKEYHGSNYGITTSNGTTALQLALLGLGIGKTDEVIVPGFTFVAPVNMVIEAGAIPVYADINPKTWCIDPLKVEECISNKTKAIIAVHIYGNVCDMKALKDIADKHELLLIEDTAEATFSQYMGKLAGTFGDAGCFSFQATKTITMGEGGFILTPSKIHYDKMRTIRDHGMRKDKRYWHDMIGYNFRLTNLQASIGCAQLENVDKIVAERRRIYQIYTKLLSNQLGIELQQFEPEVDPVVWAIALKINKNYFKEDRKIIMKSLSEDGIETRPGFYPINIMPLYNAPNLPVSEEVGLNVISLPSSPSLTSTEIEYVCERLLNLRVK